MGELRGANSWIKHTIALVLCRLEMVTVVGLSALNEIRLEVYLSMFALSYFMSSGLFHPRL